MSHLYLCVYRNMLFTHCECPEEGTRNVVSECLGKLTLMDPHTLLISLKQHLTSPAKLTRSTVVTAIKFTISDQVSVDYMISEQVKHALLAIMFCGAWLLI